MPLDFAFVLWVGSLILSAGAVVLFLWLMREGAKGEGRTANGEGAEGISDPTKPVS